MVLPDARTRGPCPQIRPDTAGSIVPAAVCAPPPPPAVPPAPNRGRSGDEESHSSRVQPATLWALSPVWGQDKPAYLGWQALTLSKHLLYARSNARHVSDPHDNKATGCHSPHFIDKETGSERGSLALSHTAQGRGVRTSPGLTRNLGAEPEPCLPVPAAQRCCPGNPSPGRGSEGRQAARCQEWDQS